MCIELHPIDTLSRDFLLKEVISVNKFTFINSCLVLTIQCKFHLSRFFFNLGVISSKSHV